MKRLRPTDNPFGVYNANTPGNSMPNGRTIRRAVERKRRIEAKRLARQERLAKG